MSALLLAGIALATASVALLFQFWFAVRLSLLASATCVRPSKPTVFISHSHRDTRLAAALVAVLRVALGLQATQIRCSSTSLSKLSHGSAIEDTLRAEIAAAPAFIALVTPNSATSACVHFETGARWAAKKHLAPLLAVGGDASLLDGPLKSYSALSCDDRNDTIQMIEDLGRLLEIIPAPLAAYEAELLGLLCESKLEELRRVS